MSAPEVTIGLPVRNGGKLLAVAIDSLLAQTYRDFVLVISDNESDDETPQTVQRYVAADSRVRYIRQAKNLGNPGNFRFTLDQARTPFFMWAAHDDIWSPTFVERNLAMLKSHPEAAASVSQVELVMPDGTTKISGGTYPIRGTPAARVKQYLRGINDSSRYYALFRTEILQRHFPAELEIFGFDWIVMALTLLDGDHMEVDEVLLRREMHPPGHYYKTLLGHLAGTFDQIFPLHSFTVRLREKLPPEIWRECRWKIHEYNLIQAVKLAEYRMPFLKPATRAVAKIVRSA